MSFRKPRTFALPPTVPFILCKEGEEVGKAVKRNVYRVGFHRDAASNRKDRKNVRYRVCVEQTEGEGERASVQEVQEPVAEERAQDRDGCDRRLNREDGEEQTSVSRQRTHGTSRRASYLHPTQSDRSNNECIFPSSFLDRLLHG